MNEIEKHWKKFRDIFCGLFALEVIAKSAVWINSQGSDITILDNPFVAMGIQILPMVPMAIVMGYYSYKFTGKKVAWITGLLGFFWFGILGIFIGYYTVSKFKKNKLEAIKPSVGEIKI